MQPFNISMKSRWFTRQWHVQLYSVYGSGINADTVCSRLVRDGTDICQYARQVLWGLFVAVLGTAILGGIVASAIGDFGAWLVAGRLHGFVDPGVLATAVLTLIVIFAFLVLLGICLWAVEKYKENCPQSDHPGFASLAYRSIKNKMCVELKFNWGHN